MIVRKNTNHINSNIFSNLSFIKMSTIIICGNNMFSESKYCKKLANIARQEKYDIRVLSEIYPNEKIDLEAEKKIISKYSKIILLFPMYWMSCPALTKKWIDSVISYYYYNKDAIIENSNNHKKFGIVTTSGNDWNKNRGNQEIELADGSKLKTLSVEEYYMPIIHSMRFIGIKNDKQPVLSISISEIDNQEDRVRKEFLDYIK